MAAISISMATMRAPVALHGAVAAKVGEQKSFRGTFLSSKAVTRHVRSSNRRSVIRMDGRESTTESSIKSTEGAPMAGITTSAPVGQKGQAIEDRIAYVCQDCGYIYDQEAPFEEVEDTYKCPVCTAPKGRFIMQNMTVGEAEQLDPKEYSDNATEN